MLYESNMNEIDNSHQSLSSQYKQLDKKYHNDVAQLNVYILLSIFIII